MKDKIPPSAQGDAKTAKSSPAETRAASNHAPVHGQQEAWVQRLTSGLDQQSMQLDLPLQLALVRARQNALQVAQKPARALLRSWSALSVGGALAACLACVLLWQTQANTGSRPLPSPPLTSTWDDLELLAQDDFPILDTANLDEDLEFYAWVEDELDLAG